MRRELRRLLGNLGKAAIAGGMAGASVLSAGGNGQEILAGFLPPAIGWLAYAYNVDMRQAMQRAPRTGQ